MIFKFIIDPEAIASYATDNSIGLLETERVMKAWERFGVLLVESGESGDKFHKNIKGLPQGLRKRWQEGLKNKTFKKG